jgi:hypothetical protein
MSNVKILVIVNERDKMKFVKNDEIYDPIQTGKAISNVDLGFQGDDTGDNISTKNPGYADLTALYWAWKNLKNIDYIGFNHYRRYFKFSSYPFVPPVETCSIEYLANIKNHNFRLEYLGKYDMILTKPLRFHYTISDKHAISFNVNNYLLLKKIINDLFPDYYYTFCNIMEHSHKASMFNLFITKWEIFDDYCKWLFAILKEYEKYANMDEYTIIQFDKRIYGGIGEHLLPVYAKKNKLKTKYYPVILFHDDHSGYFGYSTFRNIIHCFKSNLSFFFSRSWKWWFRDKFLHHKK